MMLHVSDCVCSKETSCPNTPSIQRRKKCIHQFPPSKFETVVSTPRARKTPCTSRRLSSQKLSLSWQLVSREKDIHERFRDLGVVAASLKNPEKLKARVLLSCSRVALSDTLSSPKRSESSVGTAKSKTFVIQRNQSAQQLALAAPLS